MVKSLVQKMKAGDFYTGVLYGMVNGVMLIPIAVSFCSIIFRHTAYQHHIQYLVRLVLFSSLVHQLAFSKFSSLPFAIGQVQDAGLIFLSAMAASIANNLVNSPDQIVPTALFTLAICTFLLGGALIVVSKLKLASVIQYLPMPVIGGYLAFIGFFCGEAGLSMMANVQVSSIKDFHLFLEWNAIVSLTPGLIGGIAIYLIIRSIKSPYVLPCCMLGILAIFYIVLVCCGMSLADARDAGWIAPLAEPSTLNTNHVVIVLTNYYACTYDFSSIL